jgi:hypothetical protein
MVMPPLPAIPQRAATAKSSLASCPPPTFAATPSSFNSTRTFPAVTPATGVSGSSSAAISKDCQITDNAFSA